MGTPVPLRDEVLPLLRRPDLERPSCADGVASDIRMHLESAIGDCLPLPVPLRVTKETVRRVLRCERHLIARLSVGRDRATSAMVAGAMADRLFAQAIVGFPLGEDGAADALRASQTAGDDTLVEDWGALTRSEQEEVRSTLSAIAQGLNERWPRLPSSARPRLQHSMRIELCGGAVILSGRVDLALGESRGGRCGTVLLDAKSGKPRIEDRDDAMWYALLETLRSGCQPFQSGNYYLSSGAFDMQRVGLEDLRRAADRAAEALHRVCRIASGVEPAVSPGPLCPWCPAYRVCDEGSKVGRDDSAGSWLEGFEDDYDADYEEMIDA